MKNPGSPVTGAVDFSRPLFADALAGAVAVLVGIGALSAAAVGAAVEAVMILFAGSFVAGFVRPSRAWLWAAITWVLATIGAGVDIHTNRQHFAWCPTPQQTASIPEVAAVLLIFAFAGAYAGVLGDAIAGWISRLGVAHAVPQSEHLQAILRTIAVAGTAGAALIVLFFLAEPLQPYGLNEPYCWDEYCFSVSSVDRVKTLGSGARRVAPHGTFYVVRADMEAPWWGRFEWGNGAVFVLDARDRTYEYSTAGQLALGGIPAARSSCHEILGAEEEETIVFDLPDDVEQPRLIIRDTTGLEGILDGLRIGHYEKAAFNLRYDD